MTVLQSISVKNIGSQLGTHKRRNALDQLELKINSHSQLLTWKLTRSRRSRLFLFLLLLFLFLLAKIVAGVLC